jgi:cell division protein FtsQ
LRIALRRQRRRVKPVLIGLAALIVVFVVADITRATGQDASLLSARERFGAFAALFGLRVRHIVVQGRDATPAPLLDAALGVRPGDPLLGFSVSGARARIETIASVEQATVERRWPDTVLVSLTERRAAAVWQNQGHFVLIDRDGAVLADQDVKRLSQGLPLLVGHGAPEHAAALLADLAATPGLRPHIAAAVRIGDRRWNLQTTNGAYVLLPEDDEAAALRLLQTLQATHDLLDRPLRVIDLRLPDRITLRPYPAPPPQVPAPDGAAAPDQKAPDQPTPNAGKPDLGRPLPATQAATTPRTAEHRT